MAEVGESPKISRQRVLLVDDNDELRQTLEVALFRAGYEVYTASSGSEALTRLRTAAVDILVIDILMPGFDGFETLQEFRHLHHKTRVVAMTGGGRLDAEYYMKTARVLGARATLLKPFSLDALLSALRD